MEEEVFRDVPVTAIEGKVIYTLLFMTGRYNFLPELFDAVGEDADIMYRLLQIFAGMTIKFPTFKELDKYLRNIRIYCRMHKTKRRSHDAVAGELASHYDLDEKSIYRIYNEVLKVTKEGGIKV